MERTYKIFIISFTLFIICIVCRGLLDDYGQRYMKEEGLTLEDTQPITIQTDPDFDYSIGSRRIKETLQSEEYINSKNWELIILVSAYNDESIEKLTNMCPELDFSKTKEGLNTKIGAIAWTLKYNHENQTVDILRKGYFTTEHRHGAAKNKFDTIHIKDDPFFKYMVYIINNHLEQEYQKTKQVQKE